MRRPVVFLHTQLAATVLACTVILIGCAVVLSGCAGPSAPIAPTYPASIASQLQAGVLSVSVAAADDDPESALIRLEELVVALADARARNEVTAARFDSIAAAIALVRSDLEAAIAAKNYDKPGKSEKGNRGKDG